MHVAAAAAAAVSVPPCHVSRPSFSLVQGSSSSGALNPFHSFKGTTVPIVASSAAITTTKTHLSNLDRVLSKPSPPSPPQPPQTTHENPSPPSPPPPPHGNGVGRSGGGGGLINALSLPSRLFPSFRRQPTDEMSPRSLTHLQRLLSETPRPSPRSSIAAAWRLYHGASSWDALLDPLDPNLRRELLRYGDFVQSAYHAFHSLPASPSSSSRHRHVILPDRSYRPTRSLFATSSLSLPGWIHQHPSAPAWLAQRSSWVGFVAVCDSDRELHRMGRRDIVVVLRGTATCHEWAENLRTSLVPLCSPDDDHDDHDDHDARVPKVARGFLSLYKTPGEHVPSLSSSIVDEVRRLVKLYEGEELSITVVGHSLGAALALLAADELRTCAPHVPPISVVSFGGPKVGNRAFAERLRGGGVNVLRIVNEGDVVTRVPGVVGPLRHVLDDGYEHVGAELKVDSRDSPCLRPDVGPVCCHDLEAYLHLVDGFAGPGREFRSDASRSVVRLLGLQRPNIKKAYANRAQALGLDPAADSAAGSADPHGYVASPSRCAPDGVHVEGPEWMGRVKSYVCVVGGHEEKV